MYPYVCMHSGGHAGMHARARAAQHGAAGPRPYYTHGVPDDRPDDRGYMYIYTVYLLLLIVLL